MRHPNKEAAKHPPRLWSVSGRAIEPHRIGFDPISSGEISPEPDAYFVQPVHPHLFQLVPGSFDTFTEFVDTTGIDEFLDWAYQTGISAWNAIAEHHRRAPADQQTLLQAWQDPATMRDVEHQQSLLREAYATYRPNRPVEETVAAVVALGWGIDAFQIDISVHSITDDDGEPRKVLTERPRHMWSRAWFELLEGLADNRMPKTCGYCSNPFTPKRSNQRYCTGTRCQQRAYDRRRTGERREYQRDYQRQRRAAQKKSTPKEN